MSKYDGLKQKKILLVEDVELNQYLARYIMESWGCIVDVADNGKKAVEKIVENNYDLVLMDIQMPEMDGMEATKYIRAMQDVEKSSVPIVALTANALKSECEVYLQIGMNDWLAKPFEEPALYSTITKNIKTAAVMNNSLENLEMATEVNLVAEEKLYNLAMVEAISGGDKSFILKMMELFLQTVPDTLNDLTTTADNGEWLPLSKHAHKLKSTIDSMGISSLKQDIRTIEITGKTGSDPELLRNLVSKVNVVMHQVMTQVREREL